MRKPRVAGSNPLQENENDRISPMRAGPIRVRVGVVAHANKG